MNSNSSVDQILNVEPCQMALKDYRPVSKGIRARMAAMRSADDIYDQESPVYFRLNQTGHVYYATSSLDLKDETREQFGKVLTFFGALTAAREKLNKTLFDYETVLHLIQKSNLFAATGKTTDVVSIKKNDVAVNLQIVTSLLPGIVGGASLMVAKQVLSGLNAEFTSGSRDANTEICHLLFICEELFGAASVSFKLFRASQKSHEKVTKSSCHKTAQEDFEFTQSTDTFIFLPTGDVGKRVNDLISDSKKQNELVAALLEGEQAPGQTA